jgi:CRP-like cAMP-binding protein
LPPSLAAEVALALRGDIVALVPIFRLINSARIALALRPQVSSDLDFVTSRHAPHQIFFRHSLVYSRGDISEDIYFIRKGSIRIVLSPNAKTDNTRAMYLQRNKMAIMRGTFYKGSHFGEMCLLSPTSLQISTALADVNSEVYSLSKSELWKIFLRIPRTEQRVFLIKLFTEVNNIQHSAFSEEMLSSPAMRFVYTSLSLCLSF